MSDSDQPPPWRPARGQGGSLGGSLADINEFRNKPTAGAAPTARGTARPIRPEPPQQAASSEFAGAGAGAAARKAGEQPAANPPREQTPSEAQQPAAASGDAGKKIVARRPRPEDILPGPLPTVIRPEQWPDWQTQEIEPKEPPPSRPSVVFELPAPRRKRSYATLISFLIFVVLPLAAVARYYIFYASDQYVSEFRFAVTEATPTLPGMPAAPAQSGSGSAASLASAASALLGNYTVSNAAAQNFVVVDYILSRQSVDELEKRIKVRELYSRPDADWWQRFTKGGSLDTFTEYWQRMVHASYDPATGLATVHVRAFRPDDAYLVAKSLVQLSEELVNRIAMRPQLDAVRYAESEAKKAEERLVGARAAMTEYRAKEGVIDPTSSVVTANVQMMQSLQGTLVQLQSQLNGLLRQQLDPNSPAVQTLRSRIQGTRDELARVEREVGQTREGTRPLTEVMSKFEQLNLDLQYAQAMVVSSRQMLDQARANAAAQHLYLTPYVTPALAESAVYPKRMMMILIYGLSFFGIWLIGLLIVRSVMEHSR